MGYRILTLNSISMRGLERLPRDRYEVASEILHPDAVLVRSADMHAQELSPSVLAVARAGAGMASRRACSVCTRAARSRR